MTSNSGDHQHRTDILIHEVMADEELCRAFLTDPERTLQSAADWGLPLSDSELEGLRRRAHRLWERVAEAVEIRTAVAA